MKYMGVCEFGFFSLLADSPTAIIIAAAAITRRPIHGIVCTRDNGIGNDGEHEINIKKKKTNASERCMPGHRC